MSRIKKIWLGIASFWPIIYMALFILFAFLMVLLAPGSGGELEGVFAIMFLLLMLIHFITIALILGLMIYYIIDAVKSESLSQNGKIGWIVALFFGGFFAMPFYWYLNIWKKTETDPAGYPGLESGYNFDPAYETEWETRQEDPVPPGPQSWR
jgi:hypothetical protein